MAFFSANVQVDLSGKTGSGAGNVYYYDSHNVGIQYANSYEVITGQFSYYNGPYIPSGGQVYTDTNYANNGGSVLTSWDADGKYYDAKIMFEYIKAGDSKKLLAYAFRLDDDIVGSQHNDKLYGYDGNDWINGWYGNDKLWGGKGKDTFYFEAQNGKDVIKDFSRKQDTIELHSSLASGYREVKAAASKYKKGVALKFASDEQIKIEGLKMKDLKKVDFDFV